MAPEVGNAPTSPPLQGGANLPQLLRDKMMDNMGIEPIQASLFVIGVHRTCLLRRTNLHCTNLTQNGG